MYNVYECFNSMDDKNSSIIHKEHAFSFRCFICVYRMACSVGKNKVFITIKSVRSLQNVNILFTRFVQIQEKNSMAASHMIHS